VNALRTRPGTLDDSIVKTISKDPYRGLEVIRAEDWVFDIGANIGAFSRLIAARIPDVRIVCVEPIPANLSVLRHNVDGIASIEEGALGPSDGYVTIFDVGERASGCHSVYRLTPDSTPIQVRQITLQWMFHRYGVERLRFLKLDCQGCEYTAVREAPLSVRQKIDYIAVEVHGEIAARDVPIGTIPHFRAKLSQFVRLLNTTHDLIGGDADIPDAVQVWRLRSLQ